MTMLWYVVKREDTGKELGRTNSRFQAPKFAKRKANEYGVQVRIEIEEHEEEDEAT